MSVTVTPYFTPTSITGCRLWLDGADSTTMFQNTAGTTPITTDGQTIGAWKDKSSNAYVFTQATTGNQPTYKVNIQNGCSITRWNGTSTGLQSSTSIPFYTSASSGGSFFFVFMITNNSSQRFLMTYQNQTSGTFCVSESEIGCPTGNVDTGNFGIHQGCSKANVALNQISTNTYVLMNLNLLSSGTAPANTTIFKNGTSSSMTAQNGGFYSGTTYPNANNSRLLNIGYRVPVGIYPIDCWLAGDIAEIVWYQSPVTDTQRQQVEAYLAQKWGLTSSLPAGHPGISGILYRSSIPAPVRVTPYGFTATLSTMLYMSSFVPYTVPDGCTSLTFNMWGAGGPGGSGGMPGGGGAYNTGRIAVTSGEILQLIIGRGGQFGTATQWSTMTNAEGGGGGGGGLSGQGGQGGGRTAIQKLVSGSYLEVVTAGGGGSAGGNAGTYGGNAHFSGTSQSAGTTYGQGRVPTGGSATAGGLNTFTARVGFPWDGTQFTGGFASNAFNVSPVTGPCGGGGGGGGYYGGGGGGRSGADTYGGGGGGSYCNATYITNYSGSNGTSNVAVASGIAGYITGCGRGGNSGSTNNGSNGLIVLTPVYPNPLGAFKTTYFLPTQISNCLIWFDAADSTKFSLTGTTVNSWTSKGSYTGNATSRSGTVTRGTATFNGLNVVQFPVGSELGFTAAIANQPRAWFAVFKQTSQVSVSGPNFTQYFAIINQTQGNGQDSVFGPALPTNTGTSSYVMAEGPSGNPNGVQTGNTVPNGFNVMKQYGWINSAASTASNFQTVNATSYTLTTNFTATSYATGSLLYTINTGWYNNSCDLAEIILYNGEITTVQRQSVEGYLAQKWGLTSSLPADHPGLTSIFYRNS